MTPGYRGECGMCDFVAHSAKKMECHLLTHGIVLKNATDGVGANIPVRKRVRGKRKRLNNFIKPYQFSEGMVTGVKAEVKFKAEVQAEVKSKVKTEVEKETDTNMESEMATLSDPASFEPAVLSKSELFEDLNHLNGTTLDDSFEAASHKQVFQNFDLFSQGVNDMSSKAVVNSFTVGSPILSSVKVKCATKDSQKPFPLFTFADANSSSASSATLSTFEDDEHDWKTLHVKQEPVDPSYEQLTGTSVTPEQVSKKPKAIPTPPDHDYTKREELDTADAGIPDALKAELLMNCVSIKQEEFDKMDSEERTDEDQGVIIIAPQPEEEGIRLADADNQCSSDIPKLEPPPKQKNDSTKDEACFNVMKMAGAGFNLMKTSVLKSILAGKVAPPEFHASVEPSPPKCFNKINDLKRKMYSLPCRFTREGKLHLVPATSGQMTHYIMVMKSQQSTQPSLFLVAKSKIQELSPALTPRNTGRDPPSPPDSKLTMARYNLNSILDKARRSMRSKAKAPAEVDNEDGNQVGNGNGKKTAIPDAVEKARCEMFCCQKRNCSFNTKIYGCYQEHVKQCWQDHGFMVCDLCNFPFRTRGHLTFKLHCKRSHGMEPSFPCSRCFYLSTSKQILDEHIKMYHHDSYAPESPFPWRKRVLKPESSKNHSVEASDKHKSSPTNGYSNIAMTTDSLSDVPKNPLPQLSYPLVPGRLLLPKPPLYEHIMNHVRQFNLDSVKQPNSFYRKNAKDDQERGKLKISVKQEPVYVHEWNEGPGRKWAVSQNGGLENGSDLSESNSMEMQAYASDNYGTSLLIKEEKVDHDNPEMHENADHSTQSSSSDQQEFLDGTVEEPFNFGYSEHMDESEDWFPSEEEGLDSDSGKSSKPKKHSSLDKDYVRPEPLESFNHQPRQSGRIRKQKHYTCNLSCCVQKAKRKYKKRKHLKEIKSVTDLKLISKPVVHLIDIMPLMKPVLEVESPKKFTQKQTARKSCSKRTRLRRKSNCSCCV